MDFDRTSPEWSDYDYATFRYGCGGDTTVVTKILTKEAGLVLIIIFMSLNEMRSLRVLFTKENPFDHRY